MNDYELQEQRKKRTKIICQLTSFFLFLIVWEISGRNSSSGLFPPLSATLISMFHNTVNGKIIFALGDSLQAFFIGFCLATFIGLSLGLLAGRFRRVEQFLDFYINILIATPIIIFLPLFVAILGIGLTARVAVVTWYTTIIILVNTIVGVKGVNPDLVEMARSFNSNKRQIYFKILIPAALPMIMSGLRLGIARAFIGMIFSDVIMAAVGIGYLILQQASEFQAADLFGSTLVVIVFSVAMNYTITWATGRLSSWRSQE